MVKLLSMKVLRHANIIFLLAMVILASCTSTNLNEADKIVISFRDSSVPPEYHRSYRLTVTAKHANLIVHVYGDTLMDTTLQMPSDRFDEYKSHLKDLQIREQKDEGIECSGGASVRMLIKQNANTIMKGITYMCSGKSYGTISASQEKILKVTNENYPEIKKLIESTAPLNAI